MFLGYALYSGWNLEGWRTDRRPWGVGDDGRIGNLLEKTQCQRCDISQSKKFYSFQSQMDEIKTLGGDQELRTSTLVRPRPIQGESNIDFLGESEGSLPQPQDSFPDAVEAINDFWSMSGNFIYRHHVEPRVKLYSPREESFPVPLSFQNSTYEFGCQAKELEHWWLSRLVWSSVRFHTVCSVGRRTSRVRLTRKQFISRPRLFLARTLEENGKARPNWRKSRSDLRKSTILKTHENCVYSWRRPWHRRGV